MSFKLHAAPLALLLATASAPAFAQTGPAMFACQGVRYAF